MGITITRAPKSLFLCLIWLTVGVFTWTYLSLKDTNLIFSISLISICGASIVHDLFNGAATKLWSLFKSWWFTLFFMISISTTFFYTSSVEGSLGSEARIPSACIGLFHFHHWLKATLLATYMTKAVRILNVGSRRQLKELILWTLVFGVALLGIFGTLFLTPDSNQSMKLICLGLAILMLTFSWILTSDETDHILFSLFLALTFGVVTGIFINGYMGIMKGFLQSKGVPEILIFFNQERDPACYPNP
jgi:hypothetical protein